MTGSSDSIAEIASSVRYRRHAELCGVSITIGSRCRQACETVAGWLEERSGESRSPFARGGRYRCVVEYMDRFGGLHQGRALRQLGDDEIGCATVFSTGEGRYGIHIEDFGFLLKQPDNTLAVFLDRTCLGPSANRRQKALGCELLVSHFLMAAGFCLVHAGGVSRDGRCVLWTGLSGAGKTTRVLELVQRGWDYCGDDVVALRRGSRGWEVWPCRTTAHVGVDTCARFDELAALASRTPAGDKHLFEIKDYFPVHMPESTLLERIYYLRPDGDEGPQRLSATEAFALLAPGFLYYLWPDDGQRVLDMVLAIVSEAAVFTISRDAAYRI